MYYLWKNTPYGIIRVSYGGLKDFANEAVKSRLRLYSVTLQTSDRKEDADMSIVLSEENVIPETKKKVEQHFTAVFAPMGINASVVWTVPEKSIAGLLCSPWVWAGAAACIAGFVNAGDLIVSQGEMVTSEIAQVLDSYKAEYEDSVGIQHLGDGHI